MGLVALPQGIFYGPTTERNRERTTMAVVAQVNDDADRFLQMVTHGRPFSGSVMQAAGSIGAIPLRGGAMHATAKLLPFQGDTYAVFAVIEIVRHTAESVWTTPSVPWSTQWCRRQHAI